MVVKTALLNHLFPSRMVNADDADCAPSMRFRGNAAWTVGLLEQHLDSESVVHFLAAPARGRGVLIDLDALFFVVFQQLVPVGQGAGVIRGDAVETLAVGFDETQCTVVHDLHYHPALMYLAVMEATELHQV
jgi:hypothetical protein